MSQNSERKRFKMSDEFTVTIKDGGYQQVPAGTYKVEFVQIESDMGKYGEVFRPTFEILEPSEQRGNRVKGLITKGGTTTKSALGRFVVALTGNNLSGVELNSLIGTQLWITVEKHGQHGNKIVGYKHIDAEKDN